MEKTISHTLKPGEEANISDKLKIILEEIDDHIISFEWGDMNVFEATFFLVDNDTDEQLEKFTLDGCENQDIELYGYDIWLFVPEADFVVLKVEKLR